MSPRSCRRIFAQDNSEGNIEHIRAITSPFACRLLDQYQCPPSLSTLKVTLYPNTCVQRSLINLHMGSPREQSSLTWTDTECKTSVVRKEHSHVLCYLFRRDSRSILIAVDGSIILDRCICRPVTNPNACRLSLCRSFFDSVQRVISCAAQSPAYDTFTHEERATVNLHSLIRPLCTTHTHHPINPFTPRQRSRTSTLLHHTRLSRCHA